MYFMLRLDFVRMRGIIARILVVGGSKLANGGDCVSECEFFTTDGVTQAFSNSTALVGLQQPRRGANLLTMSGHGRLNHFILAGGSCGSETLNSIELMKCKSTSDGNFQWSEKWRMSKWKLRERRSCGMGVRFNDVFLLLGGYDGLECLKSVESHGITDLIEGKEQCEDNSKCLRDLICPIKNGAAVTVTNLDGIDEFVLIFGGWDGRKTLDSIFKYDPVSGEMSFEGRLPYPIECHSTCSLGDKVFLVGGFDGLQLRNEILIYDISKREVTVAFGGRLETARECHSICLSSDGRHLIVMGGWDGFIALNSVEIFQLRSDEVVKVEMGPINLAHSRNRLQTCLVTED